MCLLVVAVGGAVVVVVAGVSGDGEDVVVGDVVGGVGAVGGGWGSVSRWRARSYAHLG